jgi:hypothetical protein
MWLLLPIGVLSRYRELFVYQRIWVVVYLGQYLQTHLLGYYKQSALGLGNRITLAFARDYRSCNWSLDKKIINSDGSDS